MKIQHILAMLSVTLLMVLSVAAQDQSNRKNFYADTTLFATDTVLQNVNLEGKSYSIKIVRDKTDEHMENFTQEGKADYTAAPITVIFSTTENDRIVYAKRFEGEPDDYPYLYYEFYKASNKRLSKPGRLYFRLNKGYGGSGSTDHYYYFDATKEKINCSPILNASGDLAFVYHNKADNEILVVDGIWNMSQNEVHYDNHRYSITRYIFKDGGFQQKETVRTKLKYAYPDNEQGIQKLLLQMKAKEPALFKLIKVDEYIF